MMWFRQRIPARGEEAEKNQLLYVTFILYNSRKNRMSAIDQSQMQRAQPGREVLPKPLAPGKKGYPFWLGGMSSLPASYQIQLVHPWSSFSPWFSRKKKIIQKEDEEEEDKRQRHKRS
jgi:hypothetical protein